MLSKRGVENMQRAPKIPKIPTINGDEFDAFTKWRKCSLKVAGKAKAAKSSYNRRIRQSLKTETKLDLEEFYKSVALPDCCRDW